MLARGEQMKTWADVHRKARVIIEIECAAPEVFFIPTWDDITQKFQEMIAKHGPLPCQGTGKMDTTCMSCHWLASYSWDSEPC